MFTGKSGFAASSTAEDVTKGIDGTGLTAIVTGNQSYLLLLPFPIHRMDDQIRVFTVLVHWHLLV